MDVAIMNGHADVVELLLAAPPPRPAAAAAAAVAAPAFLRALQRRHGGRAEARARAAAAAAAAWVGRGFEATMRGRPLPGPARQAVAAALMTAGFRLWAPTSTPCV
jgi:hypothetical protein